MTHLSSSPRRASLLCAALAALLAAGAARAGSVAGESPLAASDAEARLDRLENGTAAALARLRLAQAYGYPPGDVGGETPAPRAQQDAAGLLVRIDRLEGQLRQINGQIEQLQFGARRIEEQLRKFQEDVEFRFQDGAAGRGAAPAPKPAQKRTETIEDLIEPDARTPRADPPPVSPARTGRRSDAFDPAKDPAAPGAPRALGSPAAPLADVEAPLDLAGGKLRAQQAAPLLPGGAPAPGGRAALDPAAGEAPVPASPVRTEFDAALRLYKEKQYESAEKTFAGILQKNPHAKLAPDAIYYLGETYFQRGRHREAAEQYLKISTQFASAPRAPEALLRLGQSLSALGAREQACATYAEVGRKYPDASVAVKAGAEREARRAQC